tara:strand:+ start:1669 stop:1992 length:324 start_codon:yes stop_codon:yes gene_type:complete
MINSEYIILFLFGGFFSVITKYLANNVSPEVGAIVATLPISLFSAYFIVNEDKLPHFISEYLKQTVFIVVMTILYLYLLNKKILKHKIIYAIIISLWILFAGAQLIL